MLWNVCSIHQLNSLFTDGIITIADEGKYECSGTKTHYEFQGIRRTLSVVEGGQLHGEQYSSSGFPLAGQSGKARVEPLL